MSFDPQPTLEGSSLLVRPLQSDDREALYAVASDPLLWALHPAHDRHERAVFDRLFDESLQSGGALLVIERESGRVIGSSRYSFDFTEGDEVEIGWTFLARHQWGGPANRELKRLMLRHALASLPRVMFRVGEHNLRSRRALEKIGAMLTGRTDQADVGGRRVLHVVYVIERDDFLRSPLNLGTEA